MASRMDGYIRGLALLLGVAVGLLLPRDGHAQAATQGEQDFCWDCVDYHCQQTGGEGGTSCHEYHGPGGDDCAVYNYGLCGGAFNNVGPDGSLRLEPAADEAQGDVLFAEYGFVEDNEGQVRRVCDGALVQRNYSRDAIETKRAASRRLLI